MRSSADTLLLTFVWLQSADSSSRRWVSRVDSGVYQAARVRPIGDITRLHFQLSRRVRHPDFAVISEYMHASSEKAE